MKVLFVDPWKQLQSFEKLVRSVINQIKVEDFDDIGFSFQDVSFCIRIVAKVKQVFELRYPISFLIFWSHIQAADGNELDLAFLNIFLRKILIHEVYHKVERLGEEFEFVMNLDNPVDDFASRIFVNVNGFLTIIANIWILLVTDVLKNLRKVFGYATVALGYRLGQGDWV